MKSSKKINVEKNQQNLNKDKTIEGNLKKSNNISNVYFIDAIVDLNQSHNQNLSFIINDLNIPIKVGFQAEFSRFFYSIILESKSIGFLEESYSMIENILGIE